MAVIHSLCRPGRRDHRLHLRHVGGRGAGPGHHHDRRRSPHAAAESRTLSAPGHPTQPHPRHRADPGPSGDALPASGAPPLRRCPGGLLRHRGESPLTRPNGRPWAADGSRPCAQRSAASPACRVAARELPRRRCTSTSGIQFPHLVRVGSQVGLERSRHSLGVNVRSRSNRARSAAPKSPVTLWQQTKRRDGKHIMTPRLYPPRPCLCKGIGHENFSWKIGPGISSAEDYT
jgi:hypothetical protein